MSAIIEDIDRHLMTPMRTHLEINLLPLRGQHLRQLGIGEKIKWSSATRMASSHKSQDNDRELWRSLPSISLSTKISNKTFKIKACFILNHYMSIYTRSCLIAVPLDILMYQYLIVNHWAQCVIVTLFWPAQILFLYL